MPVQLSINDIRITKINYSFLPELVSSTSSEKYNEDRSDKVDIQITFNFRSEQIVTEDRQHLLKIYQGVDLAGNLDMPFSLMVEIGGIFALDSLPPPEELLRLQQINCNAILFPYLREAVSEITRRGGHNPLYLQPLNFLQMHKDGVFKQDESIPK